MKIYSTQDKRNGEYSIRVRDAAGKLREICRLTRTKRLTTAKYNNIVKHEKENISIEHYHRYTCFADELQAVIEKWCNLYAPVFRYEIIEKLELSTEMDNIIMFVRQQLQELNKEEIDPAARTGALLNKLEFTSHKTQLKQIECDLQEFRDNLLNKKWAIKQWTVNI